MLECLEENVLVFFPSSGRTARCQPTDTGRDRAQTGTAAGSELRKAASAASRGQRPALGAAGSPRSAAPSPLAAWQPGTSAGSAATTQPLVSRPPYPISHIPSPVPRSPYPVLIPQPVPAPRSAGLGSAAQRPLRPAGAGGLSAARAGLPQAAPPSWRGSGCCFCPRLAVLDCVQAPVLRSGFGPSKNRVQGAAEVPLGSVQPNHGVCLR